MKHMKRVLRTAAIGAVLLIAAAGSATAQVAGSSTIGISTLEANQVALGWSVKKSILGKTVYNENSEKIGKVLDLIIAPDRNVSYVIVGAGGFVGIGRHDVAIPVAQIHAEGGRIVMPGASKAIVKAMPRFEYATSTLERTRFIAAAEQDIAQAKERLTQLQKKSATASSDVKAQLDMQVTSLRLDLKSAQEKLAILKSASANRWKEFESDVRAATLRLRKSMEAAAG